jgi:hypothetical protein
MLLLAPLLLPPAPAAAANVPALASGAAQLPMSPGLLWRFNTALSLTS